MRDTARWTAALDQARRRWLHADVAERAVITSELDALFDELGGKRAIAQAFDEAVGPELAVAVGPRHCNLRALLRYPVLG